MTTSLHRWYVRWLVRALLLLGRRDLALERIDAQLAIDGLNLHALSTRAHVLAEMGDKAASLQTLRRLVEVAPEQAAGWFNLGYLSEEMGELEQAESAFRRATELEPKLDRAWYGLALALIRQRRFDEAVPALRKNTELQPMSPYGWYQLARVHVDRQEPEEAVKIIHHLRRFEPKVAAQLVRETGLGQVQA
jgi:tetratricopeptide (TPR) repeat protein